LLLRSAGFWFPLFVGFLAVQYLGTKNLVSQTAQINGGAEKQANPTQTEFPKNNPETAIDGHFH
jgi:hypothetical protein